MTTKSQVERNSKPVSAETKRIVYEFVDATVARLAEVLKDKEPEWDVEYQWKRDTDGNFRENTERRRMLWLHLDDKWFDSVPSYRGCLHRLQDDKTIGPHIDKLVGTALGMMRVEALTVLRSLIYAMQNEDGGYTFSNERFAQKWQGIMDYFGAIRIPFTMIAPMPNLSVAELPLRLNKELVLDQLNEDEVTRCCQVGLLRPLNRHFPLIWAHEAVGLRRNFFLPKLIANGDEQSKLSDSGAEGVFGKRPILRDDLTVNDVLAAMRLFKHTQVQAAGCASWADDIWLGSGTRFQLMRRWPFGGKFQFSAGEVSEFMELWRLLEERAAQFEFGIHRFNLAFDRTILADRIVDLMITAESLYLSDVNAGDRGELRFRLALRAAKFIKYSKYSERDIFHMMRQAYDVRSAIVHGGKPKKTSLPDDKNATLPKFIDAIEELVRLGLRKVLLERKDGRKLNTEYWETLVLSNSNTNEQ